MERLAVEVANSRTVSTIQVEDTDSLEEALQPISLKVNVLKHSSLISKDLLNPKGLMSN